MHSDVFTHGSFRWWPGMIQNYARLGAARLCIAYPPEAYYNWFMKTLTVRLPEPLVADIEAESRGRKISKSDVVRERLEIAPRLRRRSPASFNVIADLVGSVDGLPSDLSTRKKHYLRATGYGQKHPR